MDTGTIIDFLIFAAAVNVASYFIAFAIAIIRIASIDEDQFKVYKDFVKTRNFFIVDKNSFERRLAYFGSLVLVPGYALGMNLLFVWHTILVSGNQGMISGQIYADQFSPIKMVEYYIYNLDDDDLDEDK